METQAVHRFYDTTKSLSYFTAAGLFIYLYATVLGRALQGIKRLIVNLAVLLLLSYVLYQTFKASGHLTSLKDWSKFKYTVYLNYGLCATIVLFLIYVSYTAIKGTRHG